MIGGVQRASPRRPPVLAEPQLRTDGPRFAVAVLAFLGLLQAVVWVVTGAGAFWPGYTWVAAGAVAGLAAVAHRVEDRRDVLPRVQLDLERQAGIALVAVGVCVGIWMLGGGPFWPIWVAVGWGAALGLKAIWTFRAQLPGVGRSAALAERVDTLERSRRGALDVQAAELQRIERDLHDGAQARLVALTMQLGRAEARLEDGSEAAALVRAAREEASEAIRELRDLARGIAPPVLADRGLEAAVQAVAERAPVPVTVETHVGRRLAPVVETAAYFVVAEGLTNVAKHAPGARARVALVLDGDALHVSVADDGPGGAVDTGSGLAGLRQRAEALDGRLRVVSPPGRGTVLEAELPCGW
jgi:signal transduction histidine kinase